MRRARRIALVILLLVTACLLIGFGLIESSWFKERARRYVINEAARYLNGTLSIGAIRGNWWSGVELLDVSVVQDGESAVAIRSLTVSYQFRELFRNGATRIRSLELSGLSLFLDHRADGSWNVAHLLKPRKTAGGPGRPIDLDRIEIGDSTILIQGNRSASAFRLPERILDINAVARFRNRADMRVIEVESLEARGIDPGFAVRRYSGTVELPDGRSRASCDRPSNRAHGVEGGRVDRDQARSGAVRPEGRRRAIRLPGGRSDPPRNSHHWRVVRIHGEVVRSTKRDED